jgi:hypothetical protein
MLSPSNVFVPKVSGTQSDATYYHPEQDIIETHNHYSRAIYTAGKRGWSAQRSHGTATQTAIMDAAQATIDDVACPEDA